MIPSALVAALVAVTGILPAQEARFGVGRWEADSFGNHRAVVRVANAADAVWAHLAWRRRDTAPERKAVLVVEARSGRRVAEVEAVNVTRESGDVVFRAGSAGEYHLYYLPYTGTIRSNYPKIAYRAPSPADSAWRARNGLGGSGDLSRLPRAEIVEFQAVDDFHRFDPMELIATSAETRDLLRRHRGAGYLVFPEGRRHSVRMTRDLPHRWIVRGPGGTVADSVFRGEYYSFQLGVWAARRGLADLGVTLTDLVRAGGGGTISRSASTCFNLGGVDWQGRPFATPLAVDSGAVQPIWCGVQVPDRAPPGTYTGTATVSAGGERETRIPVSLRVLQDTIRNAGDDEPWRLSRLRWLDSRLGAEDAPIAPFTPVAVRGDTVAFLGRDLTLGALGLPVSIRSRFTMEMTDTSGPPREILAGPMALVAEDADGRVLDWRPGDRRAAVRSAGGAAATWRAGGRAGALRMEVEGRAEFDGHVAFRVALTADDTLALRDIRLEIPIAREVARYMMGMGRKGGVRPASFDWAWNVRHNHDGAWIGDVNAGLQFSLRDDRYRRPLNTNFYLSQPLVMPASWENGGKGGCRLRERDAATYLVACFSGARILRPGERQRYDLVLLVTPFKPLDTRGQWDTRYFHAFAPLDSVAALGANTVNVHHATPINPWINYPFLRPEAMRSYVDDAHARGMRVKIYYTVRELTNRAPELFALRSLGHEVFSTGPGGGFSWLQEHLGGDYLPAWHVPEIKDAAIINTGISRWHNFYVEGLRWLVENVGIDGLYIDDVAFDRSVMQRVRRVLDGGRGEGALIDLHSANQFNERDGFVNSANLYLEHFPYVNRLWFGEYFDYAAGPDYWMVEVSGIPFGLMGEMLEKGGNPWRGMLYGMTNRLPWSGDPRPLWEVWDRFGIQESRMVGYWVPTNPVRTGREDVLATSYLREGRALVALGSWAEDTVRVRLQVDWPALGLDPRTARARAIRDFQPAAEFAPGEAIPVPPGKGWLLELE